MSQDDPRVAPSGIDVRGPRVGAGITAVLLIVVLLLSGLGSPWPSLLVLAFVAFGFGVGAVRGPQGTWQGAVFKTFVLPRIGPTTEREDPRPPTFAQQVGLIITGIGVVLGLVGALTGSALVIAIPIAAGFALIAAFLNAVFGFCLGCEIYLLWHRVRGAKSA